MIRVVASVIQGAGKSSRTGATQRRGPGPPPTVPGDAGEGSEGEAGSMHGELPGGRKIMALTRSEGQHFFWRQAFFCPANRAPW